jgi:hypothetical protein
MYKPYHAIGLELGISVASVGLRGEPTGAPSPGMAMSSRPPSAISPRAKTLDGEGGYTVYGKLVPAADSLSQRALPLGLAHGVKLMRRIAADEVVRWDDVDIESRRAPPSRFGARWKHCSGDLQSRFGPGAAARRPFRIQRRPLPASRSTARRSVAGDLLGRRAAICCPALLHSTIDRRRGSRARRHEPAWTPIETNIKERNP